jgi:hypothetical protein
MPTVPTSLQKITFGEMRAMGIRRVIVYCADYRVRALDHPERRPLGGQCPAIRYRAAVRLQRLRQARWVCDRIIREIEISSPA